MSSESRLRSDGYTLIELVVVLVVVGILLAITFPRFRDTVLIDPLDTACRRIISQVEIIREEAIREQRVYSLYLDLSGNRIWVETGGQGEENREQARQQAYHLPEAVRIRDVWTPADGKRFTGEAVVRFTPKGYTSHTVIHLSADDGREYSLELTPFLPEVKLYKRYLDLRYP